MLLTFTWNPDRFIFTIPYIDRPIAWYGALFVSGFITSYYVLIPLLIKHYAFSKNEAKVFLDRFCWYCILGTIVGARLGYILFYALPSFLKNPLDVFQVWKGGLASHGGVIGIAVALVFFRKSIKKSYPHITH
jgi:phosphatidylglycerol---prolipoprotein diacylglyceryl transferase